MQIRTQFIVFTLLLIGGCIFGVERLVSATFAPEFEYRGLEMVSVLSNKYRDEISASLAAAESDVGVVMRLFSLSDGSLREPGGSLLQKFGAKAFAVYQKKNDKWEWVGPKDWGSANPFGQTPALRPGSTLELTAKGARLWLERGELRIGLQLREDWLAEHLPKAKGNMKSALFLKAANGEITAAPGTDEALRGWRDWVQKAGFNEAVESSGDKTPAVYAALSPSNQFSFAVLTLWPRADVQSSWLSLRQRILGLGLVAIAVALIFVVFVLRRITRPLEDLAQAVSQVGKGDFEITFARQGNDELGRLMSAFTKMSGEIKALLERTRTAARMESELQTARVVQENFYPQDVNQLANVTAVGKTLSATECGGDLWACWQTNEYAYVILGDATGHGVPAALLTSGLRSAIAIFEKTQTDDLVQMVTLLRRVIETIGRGKTCMTASLLQIDKASGALKVFNADHEPTVVIPKLTSADMNWAAVPQLFEPRNPALGTPVDETVAPNFITHYLQPGDRLFFFSDGLFDLKDDEGRQWRERSIITSLIKLATELRGVPVQGYFETFLSVVEERRASRELDDDLTIVVIEWKPKDQWG